MLHLVWFGLVCGRSCFAYSLQLTHEQVRNNVVFETTINEQEFPRRSDRRAAHLKSEHPRRSDTFVRAFHKPGLERLDRLTGVESCFSLSLSPDVAAVFARLRTSVLVSQVDFNCRFTSFVRDISGFCSFLC